jgi:uncharacterized protein (TIGR04222 family)
MDLLHNPIVDMYGPYFLLFYGAVIFLVFVLQMAFSFFYDPTASLPIGEVEENVDPYELGFLRGREEEVMRLVTYDLILRGYLQEEGMLVKQALANTLSDGQRGMVKTLATLSPLQRSIYDLYATGRSLRELNQVKLPTEVRNVCEEYLQKFKQNRWVSPPQIIETAYMIWLLGVVLIVGLGGYKLGADVMNHRYDSFFLLLLGGSALVVYNKRCKPDQLSSKGKGYLARVQQKYRSLKIRYQKEPFAPGDQDLLLLGGIFGAEYLAPRKKGLASVFRFF